jgi:hypothetical protein
MAVATSAAISLGATAASTGMSFYQASQQRKLQLEAQENAKRALEDARKRLDVNFYDALSIVKEPYELEREALLTSGAQAMEAARESQRSVAGTAGRVQMAQNVGQGQIRSAMGRDLMGLEMKSAAEDARLRDENVAIDKERTAGFQQMASDAWRAQQRALQQGFAGVSSMAGQIANLAPIKGSELDLQVGGGNMQQPNAQQPIMGGQYDFSRQDPNAPLPAEFMGKMINPAYQGMTTAQIIESLQGQGALPPNFDEIDYSQLTQLIYQ